MRYLRLWGWMVMASLLCSGCAHTRSSGPATAYKPTNVYLRLPTLPEHLHRVALLPMPRTSADSTIESGIQTLEPIVASELRKRQGFEVVVVSREDLKAWTGKEAWSSAEELPEDALQRIQKAAGCQAVIFAELTEFQPYPPLAVGLRMRLVECATGSAWWAVDEVLNAGSSTIAESAKEYGRSELHLTSQNDVTMLQTPRRFGQFAAWALLSSLPGRTAK